MNLDQLFTENIKVLLIPPSNMNTTENPFGEMEGTCQVPCQDRFPLPAPSPSLPLVSPSQPDLPSGCSLHIGFSQKPSLKTHVQFRGAPYRLPQCLVLSYYTLLFSCLTTSPYRGFPGGSDGKEPACKVRDPGFIPGSGRFPWRREWLFTPVFLLGEFHEQRSLANTYNCLTAR